MGSDFTLNRTEAFSIKNKQVPEKGRESKSRERDLFFHTGGLKITYRKFSGREQFLDRRRKNNRNRGGGAFPLILLLVGVVVAAAVFLIFYKMNISEKSSEITEADTDAGGKWSEGIVTYGGKQYKYNSKIRSYLFMGIDTDEPVQKKAKGIEGGQADALFLLVEDADAGKLSVIAIHRNTMTDIQECDENGNEIGNEIAQICLQHAYGDGERLSCQRQTEAVSNLFYGIPIKGYISLNMGGIGRLNDAVGGVEVEILNDLSAKDPALVQGENVRLNAKQAYIYVRSRDTGEFDSATERMRRQKQYLSAFIPAARQKAGTAAGAMSIYSKAEDYLFTNVEYARLAEELADLEYDPEKDMYEIPGEVRMGEEYEEFYTDETGFYEMVLDIFYQEVS